MQRKADTEDGLTTSDVKARHETYGRNELPKQSAHVLTKWIRRVIAPIPLMLIAAAVFSFVLGKQFDGWFILALYFVNLGISVWHEWKAENTLALLEDKIAVRIKTKRDGVWQQIDSRELVPDDVIELVSGSVVPADAVVLDANVASVNESVVTGESLPVDKQTDDQLIAGSFVVGGIITARVTAIGANTRFGHLVEAASVKRSQSILEKDILTISRFLSVISVCLAIIISAAWWFTGMPRLEIIRFDLTLLIAGIPVALPTVISLIMSVGTLHISRRAAIVRRLSSLEDLANVDLLLSDKTGTLTKNEIVVTEFRNLSASYDDATASALAAATTTEPDYHALEKAIVDFANSFPQHPEYEVLEVIPADSVRKRSSVLLKDKGVCIRVTLGAPQVVAGLSDIDDTLLDTFNNEVEQAAVKGSRALALAVKIGKGEERPGESNLSLVGLFLLSDELREDAKDVVTFLQDNGVEVKMLTGDNLAVSREVAKHVGLTGAVVSCRKNEIDELKSEQFRTTSVFSEVYPEDKKELVTYARTDHVVAVTGDGINDLPALKTANVGVAVANAVDVLKNSADIVLTDNGISVIRDAVTESRKIFARIYSYSIYRISESFRLIVTIALFGVVLSAPLLTPIQLIILALLNDLPIITLAFNRVTLSHKPATINVRHRFIISLLYGSVGLLNSILFLLLTHFYLDLPWDMVQTLFFLKLTVSGHMLIYVAHTAKRWYRFLPSRPVIVATFSTQVIATILALFGFFMTAVPWTFVVLVWVWAFIWMQVSELMKIIRSHS